MSAHPRPVRYIGRNIKKRSAPTIFRADRLAVSNRAICGSSGRSESSKLFQRGKPRDCVVSKALLDRYEVGVIVQCHHRDPNQSSLVSLGCHARPAQRAEPSADLREGLEPCRLPTRPGPFESYFRKRHPGHDWRPRKPLAVCTRAQMWEVRVAGRGEPDIAAETAAIQSPRHDANSSQPHRQSVHCRPRYAPSTRHERALESTRASLQTLASVLAWMLLGTIRTGNGRGQ